MRSKRQLLIVLALLSIGCSGIFESEHELPVELHINGVIGYEQGKSDEYHAAPTPFVVTSEGTIRVVSDILLACANSRIDAIAKWEGGDLVIRVDERKEPICQTSTIKYAYDTEIGGLESGDYHLRFYQKVFRRGKKWPVELVLEQDVRIE